MIRWTPDGRPPRRGDPPGPGLLLDRDGCLTVEVDHLTDPTGLQPEEGAADAVARAAMAGLRIAVVTNQSVVGRGWVEPETMLSMHARLVALFPAVEAVYHCPHLPDVGCPCRKPRPTMLEAAMVDLGLDPARTTMVGDTMTDVGAGERAGVATVLLRTGHGRDQDGGPGQRRADTISDAIAELVAD